MWKPDKELGHIVIFFTQNNLDDLAKQVISTHFTQKQGMQMRDHQIQQIVVVGAGLTGVMTALALSHCGYGTPSAPAVTLIDRVNQAGAKAKTATRDHRTTTVHAAGVAMLDALGVWPLLTKMQHQFPVSKSRMANHTVKDSKETPNRVLVGLA